MRLPTPDEHGTITISLEPVVKEVKHSGQLDVLMCDYCATPLGMVYENDLNGSYFYCQDCFRKHG